MPALLVVLLGLLQAVLTSATPEIASIVKDWLVKYKEVLEREKPGLAATIEQAVHAGDWHAVSVASLSLYTAVGTDAPDAAGNSAEYQDRVSSGGSAVAGGDAATVRGPGQSAG